MRGIILNSGTLSTFALSMLVYALTLCPTVYVEGTGELIGAVSMLGTPHPTGYPLFCLFGRLVVAAMPITNTALAVNVASALSCALAATALSAFLHHRGLHPWTAAGTALTFAFSATFWSQAVIAEVYGMSMLAAVVTLAVWMKALDSPRERWLITAAFCTGVAATAHLSLALLIPGIGLLGLQRWYRSAASRTSGQSAVAIMLTECQSTAAKMMGAVCVGYSVILYLPLRSGRGSGFHWSILNTPGKLWEHLTAELYRSSFFGMPWEGALINATRFADQMVTELPTLLLAPMGWGVWVAFKRDPAVTWLVGCAAVANLLTALNYHRDPNGLDVFFLQAILSGVILLGYGVEDLSQRISRRLQVGRPATTGLLAALIAAGVISENHRQADRSDNWVAHRYGVEILRSLPPSAILLSEGDDVSFILDYLLRVENVRPDITLYNRNGLGTDLAGADAVDDGRMRARMRREGERDLVLASASGGSPLFSVFARSMPVEGFEFVPHGLVYRIARAGSQAGPAHPIDMTNVTVDEEATDDPWVRKIQANYWFMRGEHEALSGWSEAARSAYFRAGEIAPTSRTMMYNISRILFLNNELAEALDYAMKAMSIDPLWPHSYPLAVRILKRLGRLEEARMLNKRAAKLSRVS